MKITRKSLKPVKETQMVSLADIAFLIIFFFLLSSSFMKDKAAVALPTLPKTTKTKSAIIVRMDAGGNLFLDGQPVASAIVLESELRGMLAGRTTSEQCEVRFKCDRSTRYKTYKPAYEAIANAGGVIAIQHDVSQ